MVIWMTENRFLLDKIEKGNAILSVKITDTVKDVDYFIMTKEFYEDEIDDIVDLLNEQHAETERLKEQLSLVCNAESSAHYNSVKEVLRRQIFGLDCAAEESPNAWHHYRLLSKLFEEQYGEYWDNFD